MTEQELDEYLINYLSIRVERSYDYGKNVYIRLCLKDREISSDYLDLEP